MTHPLQSAAHANSVAKGFWKSPISLPEKIALIHAELSELLETYRDDPLAPCEKGVELTCEQEELADVLLRLLDLSEHLGVDLVHEAAADQGWPLNGSVPSAMIAFAHARVSSLLWAVEHGSTDTRLELAGALSAIEDIAAARGVDLWAAAEAKHAFNLTRPTMHGRKF